MAGQPMIGIVIINYNGLDLTVDCIASIDRSNYSNYRLILIDNNSPDGSGELLKSIYGSVHTVILSGENKGTSGANNLGMRVAFEQGCDYVLLLNNDTVLFPDTLEKLIAGSGGAYVGVPHISYYSMPEVSWYAGGYFDVFNNARHSGMGKKLDREKSASGFVGYAPTCCFLIPKPIYEDVGEFDEGYFMYWEDTDYCIRINRKRHKILYISDADILHKVSASSGGEGSAFGYYYSVRNRLYGIDKLKMGLRSFVWARLALLRGLLSKRDECKFAFRAWRDYRLGNMGYVDLDLERCDD